MTDSPYLKPTRDNILRLKSLPLFCDLDEDKLEIIITLSKFETFQPGEVIIKEGSEGRWLYILISGAVSVRKAGAELNVLRRCGDIFGEMFLLSDSERCATVAALDTATCLCVHCAAMGRYEPADKILFQSVFYRVLSTNLAERLAEADQKIARLTDEVAKLKAMRSIYK